MQRFLAFALLSVFLVAVPGYATIATAVPFENKVTVADSIVLGRCIRTESRFDATRQTILTWSTFSVEKTFKGSSAREVTLVTPGGSVGALHQRTVGVPEFRAGNERVLFVKSNQAGPSVLYFEQGTYDVTQGLGARLVAPLPSQIVLIDPQTGRASQAEEKRTLEEFERDVQAALRGTPEQRVARYQIAQKTATPSQTPRRSPSLFSRENRWIWILLTLGAIASALPLIMRRR